MTCTNPGGVNRGESSYYRGWWAGAKSKLRVSTFICLWLLLLLLLFFNLNIYHGLLFCNSMPDRFFFLVVVGGGGGEGSGVKQRIY